MAQTRSFIVKFQADTKELNDGLRDVTGRVGNLAGSFAKISTAANTIPAVVGTLKAMSGAVGVLPGVLAAFAAGLATVKLGTKGFADAVTGTNEELAKLSPNARNAALAVRGLGGEWDGMRKSVQNALFKDLGSDINALGDKYIPVLRTGLSGVAAGLNEGTRETAAYLARSSQVSTVADIFRNVRGATDSVAGSMSPITQILVDIVAVSSEFLPALTGGFEGAARRAADFVSAARESGRLREWIAGGIDSIRALGQTLGDVWHLLSNVAAIAGMAFQALSINGASMLDILIALTDKIRENGTWLVPLIASLYALVKVVGIVTAAIQLVNIVLAMNPVVLIVAAIIGLVAAFITLWQTSAGFRQFWIDVWKAIVDAAKWAWSNVLEPTIAALVTAWHATSDAVSGAYENVIKPVIDAFAAAGKWLWENALKPVLDGISAGWTALQPIFDFVGAAIGLVFSVVAGAAQILWSILSGIYDFVKIGFQIVGAVIEAVYTVTIDPILRLFAAGFRILGDVIAWVWTNVIKLALDALGAIAGFIWRTFIEPAFNAIAAGFRAIGDVIAWVYSNVIVPTLGFFADVFNGLRTVVEKVVAGIKIAWEETKKIFGTPVKWIVDVIWNGGIVKFWNWLASKLGLGTLDTIDTSGWPSYADGGHVRGKGGPRSDSILARVSNGEYIMPADQTAKYLPVLESMRRGSLPGYADGGVVGGALQSVLDFVGGAIGGAIEFIKDPIGHVKRAIGDNSWISMVAGAPASLITSAGVFLAKRLAELSNVVGAGSSSPDAANAQLRRTIVTAAMQRAGVGAEWLEPLMVLIQRESAWNTKAVNTWDSNAKKGTPSKGLMQLIDPTFQAHRDPGLPNDIFNPLANVTAGIRYILARYGHISRVQQANPTMPPRGYDSGGWLPPGYTTVYNGTGSPELVLTRAQYTALGDGARGERHYHLTVVDAGNGRIDLVDQFRRMELLHADA